MFAKPRPIVSLAWVFALGAVPAGGGAAILLDLGPEQIVPADGAEIAVPGTFEGADDVEFAVVEGQGTDAFPHSAAASGNADSDHCCVLRCIL